jgi:hypothetical protein
VIDLGELTGAEPSGRWRPSAHGLRRVVLLSVAALVLLGLTASGPQPPPFDQPLWTVTTGSFTWGSDTVYLVDPDRRAVSAHDPVTGSLRWRVGLDRQVMEVTEVGAGTAALQLGPASGGVESDLVVLLIDRAGRRLAQVPGAIWDSGSDGRSLLVWASRCGFGDSCATLARIDLATGAVAWSLPLGLRAPVPSQACQGHTFAVFDEEGVEIRSVATLDVTARVALPSADEGQLHTGALYDDQLVTAQVVTAGVVLTAHPLRPGGASWSLTLPQVPAGGSSAGFFLTTCTGVLFAQLENETALIDRHTGRVLHLLPGDLGFVMAGATAPDSSGPDGILLALAGASGPAKRNVVIVFDASTGAQLATFADLTIVGWAAAGGRALLLDEGGGRSGFTLLDRHGRSTRLGSVGGTGLTCEARADLLACASRGGALRVFRLPAAA